MESAFQDNKKILEMPVTILFQDPHLRDSRFLILDLRPIKGRVENEILAVTDFDLIDETRESADVKNEEEATIFHWAKRSLVR